MNELTAEYLKSIVPQRIFWRGEDLYNEGAVKKVKVKGKQVTASVLGTRYYTVTAEKSNEGFLFSCTCPYEYFCKHQIALGLWLADHKNETEKLNAAKPVVLSAPNIKELLKKASGQQKDKFLAEVLNEFPVLLNRFKVMIKGAENLGGDINIDALANEIKKLLEVFDLEDFTRFYSSAPEAYGYREDWQVLQDGAQAEFDGILTEYKIQAIELLKTRNVIGAFKYLLAIYEAVSTAKFEDIIDPACIFEDEGLDDLAETNLDILLSEFTFCFAALSLEEEVYLKLIDIYFNRFNKKSKKQIYLFHDFSDLFLSCIKTKNIAAHLSGLLQKSPGLAEEEYCELLLAIYEKTEEKEKWLDIAKKYYKTNQAVAEKLLKHFANHKNELIRLAQNIAFRFNKKFIPFFYEKLNKKDNPELYQKILFKHAEEVQTINLFKEIKKEFGKETAWEFINSLEGEWATERFYIQLLSEEKAWEKLLALAKESSESSPAMAYLRPIVNIYPEHVYTIISKHAEKYLDENTGRNYYRQTAEWLKLLKKIKHKKTSEMVQNFISHLVDKFSNRRAMKDEFSKAGLR